MTTSIDHAVVTTDDAKSIWNTTTDRCSGVLLVTPDGKLAGKTDSGWRQPAVNEGKL
ncbi:MAG: hypothetical protein K2Y35_19750 [Burkholderiales bacterium]|nr:hypothetical protein [Burkholderiales bacterium]